MAIKFDADLSQVANVLGAIEGVGATVSTRRFPDTLVKMSWAETAKDFDVFMDAVARSNPQAYHHMYEWNKVGIPGARLWNQTLTTNKAGTGIASFEFQPSVTPVPPPRYPVGEVSRLSGEKYVFHSKAAVMEFGIPVTIRSRTSGGLIFIPAPELPRGYLFAKESYVTNPGGNVAGNFTQAFSGFWGSNSTAIFNARVKPKLEAEVAAIVAKGGRVPRGRAFTLMVDTAATQSAKELDMFLDAEDARARAVREMMKYE